ncbi:AGC/PKA protein kinase, variant 1 [Aphanomyces invadans]|uniref:AGC/PKA protein kinase, variant 1 n=1 Tax=Aphanomyces invadans TaxID=157072 RepID=A0A024UWD1_9STRA|nr:AGC/PKA protein kinase, variant 1 [Aphanomyces invadans]ETW10275.1 AGC/PKA protein kinase, variant 1 [Aphanomyces invadans]|eukprot:XP_008861687.1 AGC/PKA protein kinase, variant 1 [Aphanomyces invadans]
MGGGSSTRRVNVYVMAALQDDPPPPVDWIGTSLKAKRALSLKDFDLKGLIGTGMIGHVYIAQYKLSRQYFVIKSMWKADVIDRNMLRHVQSEKQAMETLQHPFLVKYFATFQSSDQIHFVLEYVPGGELFKWLHEYHRFYDHEAKFFAAELVLVLAFVHEEGYIYRDLKPENIVLDAHGHIRLVDCGFAKYVGNPEDNGRCTTSLGTPQYLAPEQLRKNDRCYTQAVDWWAFGCVVFELLMGRTPFFRSATDTPYELYTRVVQGKLTFGDRFTPNAKDLIRQLLQPDLTKRLVDPVKIKQHDWFADVDWAMVDALRIECPVHPPLHMAGDFGNFTLHDKHPPKSNKSISAAADREFADF